MYMKLHFLDILNKQFLINRIHLNKLMPQMKYKLLLQLRKQYK